MAETPLDGTCNPGVAGNPAGDTKKKPFNIRTFGFSPLLWQTVNFYFVCPWCVTSKQKTFAFAGGLLLHRRQHVTVGIEGERILLGGSDIFW